MTPPTISWKLAAGQIGTPTTLEKTQLWVKDYHDLVGTYMVLFGGMGGSFEGDSSGSDAGRST